MRLTLYFYLPDYKIGIECQGEQHFRPIKYRSEKMMNGDTPEKRLLYNKEMDKVKKEKCKNANIGIVYFLCKTFSGYLDKDDKYATNDEELLRIIKG